MIIYKDKVSGDELFSDTYKVEVVHNNVFYRVEGKLVTESDQVDDSMFGGNASAEGGGEDYATESKSGPNICLAHKMEKTEFGDKKQYLSYLKGFMKKVKAILEKDDPDRLATFEEDVKAVVSSFVVKNFKKFDFYIGESNDPDGMIGLCNWEVPEGKEEDIPVLYFFKDAVDAEKV